MPIIHYGEQEKEIDLDQDGSLALATLKRHFGTQAAGLFYLGVDGGMVVVPFNESPVTDHSKLLPPGGVWDKDFYIFRAPSTTGDSNAAEIKQKRMEDVIPTGQEVASSIMSPSMEEARKFLYFDVFPNTANADGSIAGLTKNCVVAYTRKHAVTFKHGLHSNMRLGQTLHIYDQNGVPILVRCAYISGFNDVIIYHRVDNGDFAAPKIEEEPTLGMSYVLLGFPFESEVPQCFQGTVSSIEYGFPTVPINVLGWGAAVRGCSAGAAGPAFDLKTGRLFAINVEGPDLETFTNDTLNSLRPAKPSIAEETTHNLMIPMKAFGSSDIFALVEKVVREWSGDHLLRKTEVLKSSLMDGLKMKAEEAGGLTNKLIEKGITMENIKEEIKKIVGREVARYQWPNHKDKILEGLYSLTAEFKVNVPHKGADEHDEGSGTSEKSPSYSTQTQPDVVHSSMDCYFTVMENMQPGQENVEEATAE